MFRYRDKERLLFSPSMHRLEPADGLETSLRWQIAQGTAECTR
jgi:hypothetical protein